MPNQPSPPVTPAGLLALLILCATILAALWIVFR